MCYRSKAQFRMLTISQDGVDKIGFKYALVTQSLRHLHAEVRVFAPIELFAGESVSDLHVKVKHEFVEQATEKYSLTFDYRAKILSARLQAGVDGELSLDAMNLAMRQRVTLLLPTIVGLHSVSVRLEFSLRNVYAFGIGCQVVDRNGRELIGFDLGASYTKSDNAYTFEVALPAKCQFRRLVMALKLKPTLALSVTLGFLQDARVVNEAGQFVNEKELLVSFEDQPIGVIVRVKNMPMLEEYFNELRICAPTRFTDTRDGGKRIDYLLSWTRSLSGITEELFVAALKFNMPRADPKTTMSLDGRLTLNPLIFKPIKLRVKTGYESDVEGQSVKLNCSLHANEWYAKNTYAYNTDEDGTSIQKVIFNKDMHEMLYILEALQSNFEIRIGLETSMAELQNLTLKLKTENSNQWNIRVEHTDENAIDKSFVEFSVLQDPNEPLKLTSEGRVQYSDSLEKRVWKHTAAFDCTQVHNVWRDWTFRSSLVVEQPVNKTLYQLVLEPKEARVEFDAWLALLPCGTSRVRIRSEKWRFDSSRTGRRLSGFSGTIDLPIAFEGRRMTFSLRGALSRVFDEKIPLELYGKVELPFAKVSNAEAHWIYYQRTAQQQNDPLRCAVIFSLNDKQLLDLEMAYKQKINYNYEFGVTRQKGSTWEPILLWKLENRVPDLRLKTQFRLNDLIPFNERSNRFQLDSDFFADYSRENPRKMEALRWHVQTRYESTSANTRLRLMLPTWSSGREYNVIELAGEAVVGQNRRRTLNTKAAVALVESAAYDIMFDALPAGEHTKRVSLDIDHFDKSTSDKVDLVDTIELLTASGRRAKIESELELSAGARKLSVSVSNPAGERTRFEFMQTCGSVARQHTTELTLTLPSLNAPIAVRIESLLVHDATLLELSGDFTYSRDAADKWSSRVKLFTAQPENSGRHDVKAELSLRHPLTRTQIDVNAALLQYNCVKSTLTYKVLGTEERKFDITVGVSENGEDFVFDVCKPMYPIPCIPCIRTNVQIHYNICNVCVRYYTSYMLHMIYEF